MRGKLLATIVFALSLLLLPLAASAGELTGTITGLNCAVANKVCPMDKLDPHLAVERTFVLRMDDGKYYLIPNVSSNVLARHALEKAQVTGTINDKYGSIKATKIAVMKGDKWAEIWSMESEMKEMQNLSNP